MSPAGFEPTIVAGERPWTHALEQHWFLITYQVVKGRQKVVFNMEQTPEAL